MSTTAGADGRGTAFHVSLPMATLWWLTGLETTSSGLSVAYAAAVYSAYASLCVAFAAERFAAYTGGGADLTGARLQILLIRDTNVALLFVASTATYWCAAAYRRERAIARDEHEAAAARLFGTAAGGERAAEACCWALYALLAVVLSLNAFQRSDVPTHWTCRAAYAWGHYALLTGNMQFAVTVFGLLRCYRGLNDRVRAGGSAKTSTSNVAVVGE